MIGASGLTLLARILGAGGNPAVQADIASIAYTVRDLTTATTVASGTFVVSASMYNTLQQSDGRWMLDSVFSPGTDRRYGFNFAATIPATATANLYTINSDNSVTPHNVEVSVTWTPVAGQPFVQPWIFRPIPTY